MTIREWMYSAAGIRAEGIKYTELLEELITKAEKDLSQKVIEVIMALTIPENNPVGKKWKGDALAKNILELLNKK